MTTALQQRLDTFKHQPRVRAGSVIMSAFGDAVLPRGGAIWLGSLIALLEPLHINERLIRTSVFRLAKEGWLYTQTHGRRADYALTPAGLRRFEEASRHIYASRVPRWDERWRLILCIGELTSKQREQLKSALFWQGFGSLGTDRFIHPSADLHGVMDALQADGLTDCLPHLLPMLAADIRTGRNAHHRDIVQQAWNLDQLGKDYAQFVSHYQAVLNELPQQTQHISEHSAFLLRTLLIHDYRRLLLRDPELPDALLPAHWPGHSARQVCKTLYRLILPASESYLDQHLQLANGAHPVSLPLLQKRFADLDEPL